MKYLFKCVWAEGVCKSKDTRSVHYPHAFLKLEDLMVLKRSPDLLNNVKIGQDQLQLIIQHIFLIGVAAILVK